MKKIIFATNNDNKVLEIKRINENLGYANEFEILSLNDINVDIDVKETFETLEENALKKAKVVYKKIHKKFPDALVMAEDFGFFVEEYPEIAGVYSKRWYKGTDDDRNNQVIFLMNNIDNRNCHYKSVFALYDGEIERVFCGYTYGKVAIEKRGTNGFAYDPIIELENGKTIAELDAEEKDKISSRKEAFEYLIKNL